MREADPRHTGEWDPSNYSEKEEIYSLLMGGVADLVQGGDEFLKLALLQGDPHVQDMVGRGIPVTFPPLGDVGPGMLDLEVIPYLGDKRLGSRQRNNSEGPGG